MERWSDRYGWLAACTVLAAALSACSSVDVRHETLPAAATNRLAVAGVVADDLALQRAARRYVRALVQDLRESGAFSEVLYPAPADLPDDTARLSARFVDGSEGIDAVRFLVGYGVAAPSARVEVRITDANGRDLAVFEQTAQSTDGSGYYGGWDAIDTLAARTAIAVTRWRRGEGLD